MSRASSDSDLNGAGHDKFRQSHKNARFMGNIRGRMIIVLSVGNLLFHPVNVVVGQRLVRQERRWEM
jgi:hypothetical protein